MSTSLLVPAKINMCQSCLQSVKAVCLFFSVHNLLRPLSSSCSIRAHFLYSDNTNVGILSGAGSSWLKYIPPKHSHDRTYWIYLTQTLRGTCSHERSHTTITTKNFNLEGNQAHICLVCLAFCNSLEWRPFTNQFACWFRALRALQCNPASWGKKKQNYIPAHMDGSL